MMSYDTVPKMIRARKLHSCFWCGQSIKNKEACMSWSGFSDDGPYRSHMHPECNIAAHIYCEEYGYDEIEHGVFTRGCTCEAGDVGHMTYESCRKIAQLRETESKP